MSVDTKSLQGSEPASIEEIESPPRGGVWKVLANLFALIAVLLYLISEMLTASSDPTMGRAFYLGELCGGVLAILALPLVFVLLARLFARPYTKRSFWKAYCIGMSVLAVTQVSVLMRAAADHVRGKAEAMPVAKADTEWTSYLSAAGGFSVEMPGTPEPTELPDGAGVKLVKTNVLFSVAFFPVADIELHPLELFARVAEEYRTSYGAEVKESSVYHAGMIGSELRMKLPDGQDMVSRLYTKDDIFYETAVGGPGLDEAVANRFLDSFQLVTPEG